MKKCTGCGGNFPETHFRFMTTSGTFRTKCKTCERAIEAKRREEIAANPTNYAYYAKLRKDWRSRNADKVREYQKEYHRAYRKRLHARKTRPQPQDG